MTPENEMKGDALEPSRGSFGFSSADRIVSHAQSRGMDVRGHTLVRHSQLSGRVSGLGAADLRTAMNNHITEVVTHYKGEIHSWDVVNEAFQDGGSGARRSSPFQDKLGDGFIEEAFRTARAADPNARLCYNDYNTDGVNAKSTAVYTTAEDGGSGCNGKVTITAGSSPISGWSVDVTPPAPQQVVSLWNGSSAWNGDVMTVRSSWNGTPAAGASTSFGFTVNRNGGSTPPQAGACTAS